MMTPEVQNALRLLSEFFRQRGMGVPPMFARWEQGDFSRPTMRGSRPVRDGGDRRREPVRPSLPPPSDRVGLPYVPADPPRPSLPPPSDRVGLPYSPADPPRPVVPPPSDRVGLPYFPADPPRPRRD